MSILGKIPDPIIKGKKAGYNRAANEYGPIYKELEREYRKYPFQIESEWDYYEEIFDKKIGELQKLEKVREKLEKLCSDRKSKDSGLNYDLNNSTSQRLTVGPKHIFFGICGAYKFARYIWEKKYINAEREGYNDMKRTFDEKKRELCNKLVVSKTKLDENKSKMIDLMLDLYNEIAENKIKIQKLELIIGEE